MDLKKDHEAAPELQRWFAAHQTSADVAQSLVASFEDVASALSPVIGGRGASALIDRSIHLTGVRYPWLRADAETPSQSTDLVALGQSFVRQDLGDAASGASDLLHTLRTLLFTLIGESLTEALLGPAWNRFSNEIDVHKVSS